MGLLTAMFKEKQWLCCQAILKQLLAQQAAGIAWRGSLGAAISCKLSASSSVGFRLWALTVNKSLPITTFPHAPGLWDIKNMNFSS